MPSISEIVRSSQQINLRAPDGLHERLKDAARLNGRSVNAEILKRLEASFDTKTEIAPALSALLEQHIQNEVKARLKAVATQLGASE